VPVSEARVAATVGERVPRLVALRYALLNPTQLAPVLVMPLFAIGRDRGWIVDYPLWMPVGCIVLAQVLSTASYAIWPKPERPSEFWGRASCMTVGIALSIYVTGWGATFGIGFAFAAVELIRTSDSRAARPTLALAMASITVGELLVGLGVVKTLLPQPQGHGLAALQATGVGFVIAALGWTSRAKEERDAELRQREEWFRALAQHASDVVVVIAADHETVYVSPSVRTLLGYSTDDRVFRPELLHPDDAAAAFEFFQSVAARPDHVAEIEVRLRHADGRYRSFEVSVSNRLHDPNVRGMVCNLHDVTDRRRVEEELQYQAHHDSLTGLPNRASFLEYLDRSRRVARRERSMLAVLFLDVDRFKLVNDSLGHEIGDRLLVDVAERLRCIVRPGDIVARFGGDEFTVLLGEVADASDAVRVAERITDVLRRPVTVGGRDLVVSSSIGIALSYAGADEPSDLLRQADLAMYVAKEKGRSRWELFDAASAPHVVERLELEGDLWRALDRDELVVHFQPEVTLATEHVVAAEALVRWNHPTRGVLAPGEFVPFAEESSLICSIDRYVLGRACEWAKRWSDGRQPSERVVVSVNLSPRFVRQNDAVADITSIVRAAGVDPRCLQLEITERTALTDVEHTVATLHALRTMGMRVAIDDFGTGYSSLGYLKRLPVDVVKLDRSFVEGMDTAEADVAIVQAVITMGHALGMKVTAEGVERAEQASRLAELGCDTAMGWYWSPSLPPEVLSEVLRDGWGAAVTTLAS
jgi:diguanylate cyclase (GGDEF)-like protein/PAS domain S-box-containing protein